MYSVCEQDAEECGETDIKQIFGNLLKMPPRGDHGNKLVGQIAFFNGNLNSLTFYSKYMPNNEGFIVENVKNLCKTAIDLRKKVCFIRGPPFSATNVHFLHYHPAIDPRRKVCFMCGPPFSATNIHFLHYHPAIDPRKKVCFVCGPPFSATNIHFLHYHPGNLAIAMIGKGGV